MSWGYIDKIIVYSESGEKMKFKPEEIVQLKVKASSLLKMTLAGQTTSSVKKLSRSDIDEIIDREHIIFETAQRHNKKGKLKLMQLLNHGFDKMIKVFADPNANETSGIGYGGLKLTGGESKSYIFVKGEKKGVMVKKGSYKKTFRQLYQDCPEMMKAFAGSKIKWDDAASHVLMYEQGCAK